MSRWSNHVAKWSTCTLCPLHETRHNVVLARGSLPCDVLFVGEAPGPGEDMLGKPFVGPAGKLLDRMIREVHRSMPQTEKLRLAFTNLVACIPIDIEEGGKFAEPPKESIEECAPRLLGLVEIAKPRLIVRTGVLAKKWVYKIIKGPANYAFVDIVHPAAILRADISQRGLAIQKVIITLADAFEELT